MPASAIARGTIRDTFKRTYERELAYVWRSLARLGVPERDRSDVAHDVFLVLHRKLATLDLDRPIRPFLFGIAYRRAAAYRRKLGHQRERLSQPEVEIAAPAHAEDEAIRRQGRRLVLSAINEIPMDRRAVFVMCDVDGVPVPQVAEILEIKLNTAYSRLRLARRDFEAAARALREEAS